MGAFKGLYASVESAHCLDVNRLASKIKSSVKESSAKNGKTLSADMISQSVALNLSKFLLDSQSFDFTSVPNKLGGSRWLVLCPKCGKRVLKLYKPAGEDLFCCKDCYNLRSPSALYGPTRRYHEVVKPLRRMERIKEILATSQLSELKTKALLDEYDILDKRVQSSTFYRKAQILVAKDTPTGR